MEEIYIDDEDGCRWTEAGMMASLRDLGDTLEDTDDLADALRALWEECYRLTEEVK